MPYLTGSPIMTQLALRPASDPVLSTDANAGANPSATDSPTAASTELVVADEDGDTFMEDYDRVREERSQKLKAKNRRKRYLEVHPEYFDDDSLELVDPVLYDRLIRRFQTAAEREAEQLRRGFSGQAAAHLWRAEAKKDALRHPIPHSLFFCTRGPNGEILEEDKDEEPMSKEEARAWWIDEMTQRFLRGEDFDFDYKTVDESEEYNDPEEERDREDAYFDSMESDYDLDDDGKERVLTGETGIQDF
ncbi:hypothetical protein BU26DRAFT_245391 [Trematosphaeria pertusa]|uniref:CCD97-like C-terminal domain-containing protein n=1 Tax=Trematosphaeria pertusa TaxID=390896 RepID=A0A6A6IQI5_9PLEO|nr:uncharacterized protein BU26DRAFT_245391 [Trematosphaeria pertusa]KAF2251830.1 hypothetical protein BU26DRAFT_245391 [Trematosphaeria pertusa]